MTSPIGPGVRPSTTPYDEVARAAREAGWAVVALDTWGLLGRSEVLLALGRALGFPEWATGRSLDAVWDHLRDLPGPVVLVWNGWADLAAADPAGYDAVVGLLGERGAEAGDLTVLLRGND